MQKNDINTGFITGSAVKKYINFFCAAVESEVTPTGDIKDAYNQLHEKIKSFSRLYGGLRGIRVITEYEDVLSYFFDQKNTIPVYVCYWLMCCYDDTIPLTNGSIKLTATYKALQKLYIQQYRWCKHEDAEDMKYGRMWRRKLCKMYRSGLYAATFKLYGKPSADIIDSREAEDIETMLSVLFPEQMFNDNLTIGYMIGRIQGRSETGSNT